MHTHTPSLPPAPTTARSRSRAWRTRRLPIGLATAGSLLSLVACFLPWYQVGAGHTPRTLAEENPVLIAPLAAVVLVSGLLAAALARGLTPTARVLRSVFVLSFATTLATVFALFLHRPGGNAATLLAAGGYPALLGVGLVKGAAVVALARSRRKTA